MPKFTPHEQTPPKLLNVAREFEQLAADLRVVAELMEKENIPALDEVPMYRSLMEGMDKLSGWTQGVRDRLRDERHKRGDFGASPPEELEQQAAGRNGTRKSSSQKSAKRDNRKHKSET